MPLLIDRPWDATRTSAAMREWLAELAEMRERYSDDEEAVAQIDHEIAQSRELLTILVEHEENGIEPPPDDRSEPLY